MPRIFSEDMFDEATLRRLDEAEEAENDDFNPYAVLPAAFVYLSPPDWGGPKGMVRVAVRPDQVGKTGTKPRRSLIGLLLPENKDREREQRQARVDLYFALLAQEMARLGAVRAYLRYDGGNDEGFAWFDHCVMRDGSTRNAEEVARHIEAAAIKPPFAAWEGISARDLLDDAASEWSCVLLGRYGTGPYAMYGAFSVDLQTGVVTDDPNPTPIVRNIQFASD